MGSALRVTELSNQQEYWDYQYSKGDYRWGIRPSATAIEFLRLVNAGQFNAKRGIRLADIGAGYLRDTFHLHAMGHNVVAIENSQEAINLSQKLAKETNFQYDNNIQVNRADFANASLQSGEFEALISHRGWHQEFNSKKDAMNAKATSILAPGGRIIISARHISDYDKETMYKDTRFGDDEKHLYRYKTDVEGYEDRKHHILSLYSKNKFREEFGKDFENFEFVLYEEPESTDHPDKMTKVIMMSATKKYPLQLAL